MAHNRKTILVLAPQGSHRSHLLRTLTQRSDYDPVASGSGAGQVLKLIDSRRPSLVIIDSTISSPWPILRLIKTAWPEIPCIFLAKNIWQKIYAQEIGCDIAVSAMRLTDPLLLAIIHERLEADNHLVKQSAS